MRDTVDSPSDCGVLIGVRGCRITALFNVEENFHNPWLGHLDPRGIFFILVTEEETLHEGWNSVGWGFGAICYSCTLLKFSRVVVDSMRMVIDSTHPLEIIMLHHDPSIHG